MLQQRLKTFLALFKARNIEFIRDRGALSWTFLLPVLIVLACAFAFSNEDDTLVTIAYINSEKDVATVVANKPYTKQKAFDHIENAMDQLSYQRVDLLIDSKELTYWVNENSAASQLAEDIYAGSLKKYKRQALEGDKLRYIDWSIPGILGMNMMFSALFGAGYVIVRYRNNGVLKRYQATPISAFDFLSAQVASRLIIILCSSTIIFIGCHILLDFVVLGSYGLLLFVAFAGTLAMVSLGLLVSARTISEELAGGLLNMLTWPMMLMSEVWFSLDDAPEWMQQCSSLMPLTHVVKSARAIMLDGAGIAEIAHHLLVLMVMAAVFLTSAAYFFRWHKE